jgi:pimeloyl-ACP methyl ester carboxylesterase
VRRIVSGLVLAAAVGVSTAAAAEAPPPEACRFGAYRLSDGAGLTIEPRDLPNLRFRMRDGAGGALYPTDGAHYEGGDGWSVRSPAINRATFKGCDLATFQRDGGPPLAAQRVRLAKHPITFASGPERLYGELVTPEHGRPKAVVVLHYGSGKESAVVENFVQYMLPLDGIAVFVFDKRGTGRSTGAFTADFHVLARDMAAAIDAVRARPEAKGVRLGVMGESQGGWVAPLAASLRKVDFVVAAYSLAVSPIAEDRDEVAQTAAPYGPEALAHAERLHEAALRVAASRFTTGLDELERLKALYRDEPWFKGVGGDFTSLLASTPREKIGEVKAAFDFPIELDYEPEPVLAALKTPMLWVLAGKDTEAPHEATQAVLQGLQAKGSPVDIVVFPNADHAMIEVADGPGGRRYLGRQSPGYFDLLADWIATGRLGARYGAAEIIPRR